MHSALNQLKQAVLNHTMFMLDAHEADARTEYLQGADGEMVPETVSTDGLLMGFFRPKILAHWNRKLASKQAALAHSRT